MQALPKKGPDWSTEMGRWLAGVRMDGVEITAPTGMHSIGPFIDIDPGPEMDLLVTRNT